MNDTYVEWMVKRKTSVAMKFLKMLLIILCDDWSACHGCF